MFTLCIGYVKNNEPERLNTAWQGYINLFERTQSIIALQNCSAIYVIGDIAIRIKALLSWYCIIMMQYQLNLCRLNRLATTVTTIAIRGLCCTYQSLHRYLTQYSQRWFLLNESPIVLQGGFFL